MVLLEDIPAPSAASITRSELDTLLSIYPIIVRHLTVREAKKISETTRGFVGGFHRADECRYEELPRVVAQRKAETGQAWMEKKEVQDAMDWKLYGSLHRLDQGRLAHGR